MSIEQQNRKTEQKKEFLKIRLNWETYGTTSVLLPFAVQGSRRSREEGEESLFKKIIAENFLNFRKETEVQ